MAEMLGPVVAVDASGFSAEVGALCLLQSGPAGGEPEPAESVAGRPGRRSFETGSLVRSLYAEIRALAASQLADQWAANSLHPTALANEAVMRILEGVGGEWWDSPRHFLGAAAKAMQRVIVDRARQRKALKRGGGLGRQEISSLGIAGPDFDTAVLFVNDALEALAREDEVAAEVFRLRYFGGFTVGEVASKTGIPRRSVDRRLAYARAWLACRWDDEAPRPQKGACRHGDA